MVRIPDKYIQTDEPVVLGDILTIDGATDGGTAGLLTVKGFDADSKWYVRGNASNGLAMVLLDTAGNDSLFIDSETKQLRIYGDINFTAIGTAGSSSIARTASGIDVNNGTLVVGNGITTSTGVSEFSIIGTYSNYIPSAEGVIKIGNPSGASIAPSIASRAAASQPTRFYAMIPSTDSAQSNPALNFIAANDTGAAITTERTRLFGFFNGNTSVGYILPDAWNLGPSTNEYAIFGNSGNTLKRATTILTTSGSPGLIIANTTGGTVAEFVNSENVGLTLDLYEVTSSRTFKIRTMVSSVLADIAEFTYTGINLNKVTTISGPTIPLILVGSGTTSYVQFNTSAGLKGYVGATATYLTFADSIDEVARFGQTLYLYKPLVVNNQLITQTGAVPGLKQIPDAWDTGLFGGIYSGINTTGSGSGAYTMLYASSGKGLTLTVGTTSLATLDESSIFLYKSTTISVTGGEGLTLVKSNNAPSMRLKGTTGNDYTLSINSDILKFTKNDGLTSIIEMTQAGGVALGLFTPGTTALVHYAYGYQFTIQDKRTSPTAAQLHLQYDGTAFWQTGTSISTTATGTAGSYWYYHQSGGYVGGINPSGEWFIGNTSGGARHRMIGKSEACTGLYSGGFGISDDYSANQVVLNFGTYRDANAANSYTWQGSVKGNTGAIGHLFYSYTSLIGQYSSGGRWILGANSGTAFPFYVSANQAGVGYYACTIIGKSSNNTFSITSGTYRDVQISVGGNGGALLLMTIGNSSIATTAMILLGYSGYYNVLYNTLGTHIKNGTPDANGLGITSFNAQTGVVRITAGASLANTTNVGILSISTHCP